MILSFVCNTVIQKFLRDILFSRIAFKRCISDVNNLHLGCDLSISVTVDEGVISPFLDGFIFTKLCMQSFVKIKPSQKNCEFTV